MESATNKVPFNDFIPRDISKTLGIFKAYLWRKKDQVWLKCLCDAVLNKGQEQLTTDNEIHQNTSFILKVKMGILSQGNQRESWGELKKEEERVNM